jgi:hypothetical protein
MGEDSLLVVSGPRHKYLRALLAPAFNPDAVAGYTPQIVQLAQRHLQDWAAAGEDGVQGLDALKLLTFEFIVQVGATQWGLGGRLEYEGGGGQERQVGSWREGGGHMAAGTAASTAEVSCCGGGSANSLRVV